ncbi:hypothetical protein H6F67_14430 [Microcoleus sp. FACHB-1515]|uniref:hypothetical protein n=1 Tax=Cyanophyceae TaxID=3028117 RepID=UPI001689EFE9|nr:hypothetical protein [Microcoleus sp. FACHB-1515]MBD2091047.1 hypothetical protein [Microcoleus sp. FACHB-1515]
MGSGCFPRSRWKLHEKFNILVSGFTQFQTGLWNCSGRLLAATNRSLLNDALPVSFATPLGSLSGWATATQFANLRQLNTRRIAA